MSLRPHIYEEPQTGDSHLQTCVVIIINVLIILVLVIINTATDHASNLS